MTEKEKCVEKKAGKPGDKMAYRTPQLVVYGDIREVTLTAQKAKTADNKGKEMNMTG